MAWIPDNTWPLFCKVRQIGNRLVELRSHKQFLASCKDENLIANGFIIKNRITLGNFRRRRNIQNKFMETSRYAQGEVLDWTKEEVAYLNRIYHMGKEELLRSLGRREGGRVQLRIENELNRKEHNMQLTKNRKLEDLRRKKQQERSCDSVHIENSGVYDCEEFIRNFTRERTKGRQKRRRINKSRRKRYKKKQRREKEERMNNMWREILARVDSIAINEPRDHKPLDNTGRVWEQSYLGLLSKGQKFIPVPKRVDTVAKFEDFEQFSRKLRLKVYFATRGIASNNTIRRL